MSDDLVERLSTEAKIWPRSDISGLLRESTTEIERLRAEVEGLRARIEGAPVAVMDTRASLGICAPTEADFPAIYALQGKRVALVVVND